MRQQQADSTGSGPARSGIEEYLHHLGRALRGPARLKHDLLTEARHSLSDSAEGYQQAGVPAAEAQRRAVAEFGSVPVLAAGYQAALAAGAVRALAVRTLLVHVLLIPATTLMWRGAPWTGPEPPARYLLLSGALDWLSVLAAALAALGFLWSIREARRPGTGSVRSARVTGWLLTGSLGLSCLCGATVYAWSVQLWDAARTWPPMLIGGLLICAAFTWLARTARSCLVTTGRPAHLPA